MGQELPRIRSSVPVVGFLLDEQDRAEATQPDLYRASSFWPPMSQWGSYTSSKSPTSRGEVHSLEGFESERRKFRKRRRAFDLVPQGDLSCKPAWGDPCGHSGSSCSTGYQGALRRNAGGVPGNWPEPKNQVGQLLIHCSMPLSLAHGPGSVFLGGFLAASLCIGFGAYFVAWRPLVGHVGDWIDGDVSVLGGLIGFIVLVAWSLVPIYAWMVLSIVFFVGWLIHRTVQMTGYGLVKTFLQVRRHPCWLGTAPDDHVVRLPVPPGITTLTVSIGEEEVAAAVEEARKATQAELAQLEFPRRVHTYAVRPAPRSSQTLA